MCGRASTRTVNTHFPAFIHCRSWLAPCDGRVREVEMISMMVAGMAMAQTAPTETAVFYFDASGEVVALDICEGDRRVPADLSAWTGSYDDGRSDEITYPDDTGYGPLYPMPGDKVPIYGWTNCREDWDLQQSVCDWGIVGHSTHGCSFC
jgi:hypothetical protein